MLRPASAARPLARALGVVTAHSVLLVNIVESKDLTRIRLKFKIVQRTIFVNPDQAMNLEASINASQVLNVLVERLK